MKKTINKVLTELKSEKPDLSYIRGLLEGLVEDEVASSVFNYLPSVSEVEKILIKNLGSKPVKALDPDLPPMPDFKNVIPPIEE